VKFGGPIGDVRDPETGLGIGTMVYGDFSIRVTDPEKLIVGLLGMGRTGNDELLAWFKNQVLKVIRDRTAELLVKKRWPLLDVTSGAYTEEIETEVIAAVKPHIDNYGLTVVRMGNFTVSIKPEDEATLKRLSKDVAYSKLAGGFQQYASGQAMLGAAEGMAKGGEGGGAAMQGMGLGAGIAMGNAMAQAASGRPAAAPVAGAGSFCPSCGKPASGKFCASCGQALSASKACAGCGTELSAGAKFCSSCGKPAS
jgi:membrane protease subunit (stomatin/prohibitin family)